MKSKAAILLRSKGTTRAVADTLGVKPRTVQSWFNGERVPTPEAQASIQGVWPDVEPGMWGEKPVTHVGSGLDAAPVPGSATPEAIASEADVQLARARALGQRAQADTTMSAEECSRVQERAARILAVAGRAAGYGVTEREILRSPKWGEVVGKLIEALQPWPDALAAVASVLEEMGVRP